MSTQSVVTAIRVIEGISSMQPVGLSALARELGQSKATVLRALATLRDLGWVNQGDPPASQWSLSFHAYAVAARNGSRTSLRDVAIDPMSQLQLDTAETIHLCIPDGRNMIVVERLDTPHALRAFMALGTALQMHASGTGLAFLAASSKEFIEKYLSTPLEARTSHSLTDPDAILRELDKIRERGYSINVGGRSEGITSIGAALCDANGIPVGSVSISGPSSRITADQHARYGTSVHKTATSISNRLAGIN